MQVPEKLIQEYKIKTKDIEKWETLLIEIKNASENTDKNSRAAAFVQILKDLPMFFSKRRAYVLSIMKKL